MVFFSAGGRARGCFRSHFTLHSRNPPCSPADDITKKVISSEDWKVKVLVTQSCLTLRKPTDCSPPGSSVHSISQARVLEWVAITFSRGSSRPRDQTQVSRMAGKFFTVWAPRKSSSEDHRSYYEHQLLSVFRATYILFGSFYVLALELTWISCWCSSWLFKQFHFPRIISQWLPISKLPQPQNIYLIKMRSHSMLPKSYEKKVKVKVAQSCLILCNPIDYRVHGILQARILEWVAVLFSGGSSQSRHWTQVSHNAGRFFTLWATR